MKHLVFIFAGVLLMMQLDTPLATRFIFFVAYLSVLLPNRGNPNVSSLVLTLIFVKIAEVATHELYTMAADDGTPNFFINNRIYLTHFVFDLLLFLFVIFRAPLWRHIFEKLNMNTEKLHLTSADMRLVVLYALYMVVDLSAAGENAIRNLEHIGFAIETAKPYWEWNWVFYHYSDTKRILMGLEFFVIWSFVSTLAHGKFELKKKLPKT